MAFTGSLLIIICIGIIFGFKQMLIRVTVVPFASPRLTLLLKPALIGNLRIISTMHPFFHYVLLEI